MGAAWWVSSAVRADVEHDVLGRAVDPRPDEPFGERFARRVDLHHTRALRAVDDLAGRDDGTDLDLRIDPLARALGGLRRPGRRGSRSPPLRRRLPPRRPSGRGVSELLTGGRLTAAVGSAAKASGGTMALRVVGAGLGRTGTASLQIALEQLLDGRCYHMGEMFGRPDDIPVWHAAVNGEQPDWPVFLADYVATVDWPACAFWRELADEYPDAIVLLSSRSSADAWWKSASDTIFQISHARTQAGRPRRRRARSSPWPKTCSPTPSRRTGRTRPRRSAPTRSTTQRCGHTSIRRASSTGSPATAGSRSAQRCRCPVPDEPFPHVEHHRRLPGDDRPRRL